MRISRLNSYPAESSTHIITAGGWAGSGKGTTMSHLKSNLERVGQNVVLIDQGIKFRAMAEAAITARQPLDSPAVLDDFLQSRRGQTGTLAVLDEVVEMDQAAVKTRLYSTEVSKASGKVGKVQSAHDVAARLLRTQIETAVEAGVNVALIDGRSIETHASQFNNEGLAKFVMGWYFKCDPAIAARRRTGIFGEFEDLSPEERETLLSETLGISDRNRSDSLREVDPLREPKHAYELDLSTYEDDDSISPYGRGNEAVNHGMAMVDTSYTASIAAMTDPITEVSMYALLFQGPLKHSDVGIRTVTNESLLYPQL